jgi:hypothetical protein
MIHCLGNIFYDNSLNHGGTHEENQAIEDALNGLNVLRNEVAAWRSNRASLSAFHR